MKLKGDKIYLKPISINHAEIFLKWINDPEVNKFMIGLKIAETIEEEIKWIKTIQNDPNEEVWSIFIEQNDKLIGNVGFHDLDNVCDNFRIGILIGEKEEWRKGYATDAFKVAKKFLKEQKNAKKINLTCHVNNIAAQKVYKKSGFKIENTQKQNGENMYYMEFEF